MIGFQIGLVLGVIGSVVFLLVAIAVKEFIDGPSTGA